MNTIAPPHANDPPLPPPPSAPGYGVSTQRILWIVGVYRAVCGAVLLGTASLLDLKVLGITASGAFITSAVLYFVFGFASFWWIQRDRLGTPLPVLVSVLLVGDVMFIAMVMAAGGQTSGSLPILLFPQLAASGWLLRTRTAFFHAAIATLTLLGLDVFRRLETQVPAMQVFQTCLLYTSRCV